MTEFPWRVLPSSAFRLVWDTMVAEPYNVRSGFQQYNLPIKTMIAKERRLEEAMKHMSDWEPAYGLVLREVENSFYEHVHAVRRGLDPSRTLRRWMRARARKCHIWYYISVWCRVLLRAGHGRWPWGDRHGDPAAWFVPQFVDAFRPFMPEFILGAVQ